MVCVSSAYGSKPWTRTEHGAVRARLMEADRSQVLPVRVGDGDVEGVLINEIVPDVRRMTPVQAAGLIVGRLSIARGYDADVRPVVGWPSGVPDLSWPMADHSKARGSFADLLSAAANERALLIRGESETGKSHMSRQMIRNCRLLPGVAAGRFDFKGTTNMKIEIEAFSRPLDIEPPTGGTVSERLGKILTELRKRARPTLLVFDTYEAAGEAEAWIEDVLLPHLAYADWLRVVVVGKSVPKRTGSVWESVAAVPLILQLPGPEDWFVYGRENRGDKVKLGLVREVYSLAHGKPSLLAGLLGPKP